MKAEYVLMDGINNDMSRRANCIKCINLLNIFKHISLVTLGIQKILLTFDEINCSLSYSNLSTTHSVNKNA